MFGLFKKPEVEPEVDTFLERQKELERQIFNKYPLGLELEYMGVKIRITEHTSYQKGFITELFSRPTIPPGIKCDYVDLNGKIERVSFTCSEVTTWET